ncbi:MAG: nicotinate (nicotinamide) nucleotide adenylyltransferase [Candidatus Sungbacteria bacterium]|nr:nicotinate (nicotinamide) nucleotide adenylyltransferase [Candidatus Sungbacteria bacterium]
MRIGILGSAFDPPHKGHIEVARRAKHALRLERLILVPTRVPPHKAAPSLPGALRFKMARIAAGKRRRWTVSDMELKRQGVSYTRDTIYELKKRYPGDEIFWIIGSDSLASMPWKWKGGYDILDLCTFVAVRRPGYSLNRVSKRILKKVVLLCGAKKDISSSTIRELF